MKLSIIALALLLGGCVSQSEFEAYKMSQHEVDKKMAELHLLSSQFLVDHEHRLGVLEGKRNHARFD